MTCHLKPMSSTNHYNHVALHFPRSHVVMRKSNNDVKRAIICRALHYMCTRLQDCHVIDLACGRGGDLPKVRGCASYLGVDQAHIALAELERRAQEMGMRVTTHVGDAAQLTATNQSAQLVLCNFALHYFCDTQQHCRTLLHTVARVLVPGGMFCGTYEMHSAQTFGMAFHATVGDCVDAVEWRVPWQKVLALAHQAGLSLVYSSSFQAFDTNCSANTVAFIMQCQQHPDPGRGTPLS